MSSPAGLVREDLRGFSGYRSARGEAMRGEVWLNANESAVANAVDRTGRCRRYPEPQPVRLREALARLYGCDPAQLLVGRGSDEAIDLLVRALCRPGRDPVVATPPVFGMYAVSARLQGVPLVEVPLRETPEAFVADIDAIAGQALSNSAKLVFLCSPSNPTGGTVALADIARLAMRLEERALVVVDEAYVEYSDLPSAVALLAGHRNVAVLRTLSKAHALAAARIGCVIADRDLVAVLRGCQAPYPVPVPCAELALAALAPRGIDATNKNISDMRAERDRMFVALSGMSFVRKVYPSQGNFLLARFVDASAAFSALLGAGVVVRDQRAAPRLGDALRITIGSTRDNARVLAALRPLQVAA